MSEFNIEIEGGSSKRLKTAGKYCDRDIVVTATGGDGVVVCEDAEVNYATPIQNLKGAWWSLPNVTSVEASAFINCYGLISVDLPVATNLDYSAFATCKSLKSVSMPLVATIRHGAFARCSSLISVNFPSVTTLDDRVFAECSSLEYVDLPLVTHIGDAPFLYCTNLKAVILRRTDTVCSIEASAFMIDWDDNGMPTIVNDKFYIPSSMYEAYRAVYEPAFAEFGFDGYFDVVFHKIEDYPEICG